MQLFAAKNSLTNQGGGRKHLDNNFIYHVRHIFFTQELFVPCLISNYGQLFTKCVGLCLHFPQQYWLSR